MTTQNNSAKFAFFYLLSLVALLFTALGVGMVIFQIINKGVHDVLEPYNGQFSDSQLKFAISSLIIATPIFFLLSKQIFKGLTTGILDKDSGIRRWLTYLILFATSVVMIIWLIVTINKFLDGELVLKFALKAVTAIGIAASIFIFYFYDIKREVVTRKNKVITYFAYASLVIITGAFIASLFFVESPREARNRKIDGLIINGFNQIDGAISTYYQENNKLPETLEVIEEEFSYINSNDFEDPETKQKYEYKIIDEKTYELCATFRTSAKGDGKSSEYFIDERWTHGIGQECLKQKVHDIGDKDQIIRPVPID